VVHGERRQHRRLTFGAESPHRVELALDDRTVQGRLHDLSNAGLCMVLPPGAPAPAAGAWLGNVVLIPAGFDPYHLRVLTVEQCSTDDTGQRVVRLTASDEQARAGLWLIMERLSRAALTSGAEDPAVRAPRPIPKRGVYTEPARLERLDFARRESGVSLRALQETRLRAERLTGNIENLIGSVEVPVGLAGPLLFRGDSAQGVFYAPMATTEGALVASVTRGALAITRCGGVSTRVIRQQMMRVPLFVFGDMQSAHRFCNWVRDHFQEIRQQALRVSRHADLVQIEPSLRGNMVTISFLYETGDAAGQNMSTSCTWHACQWLLKQLPYLEGIKLEDYFIESGLSGDKKVSFQSFISGRGTRVTAECHLRRKVVEDVLKVSPEALALAADRAAAFGMQAGTVGWNINVANVLAAMFTATGQDIACVHESSVAMLYVQPVDDGLYASIVLPSLVVGTVGGGTHLPRQKELLDLIGCAGPGKVSRLAEVIAGFCLALDLSTLGAIAGGQFATAHERLGRNRPVRWFTRDDLSREFFRPAAVRVLGEGADVARVDLLEDGTGADSSIITELTARKIEKLIGLLPARLHCRGASGRTQNLEVMVKVKPLGEEVQLMAHRMAAMCGARLASSHERFRDRTGLAGTHLRELEVYRQTDPRFLRHAPAVYQSYSNPEREAYVLVLERLHGCELLNSADQPGRWTAAHLEAAIRGIAQFHAIWYGRPDEVRALPWIGHVQGAQSMAEMSELWEDLAVHASEEFPEWFSQGDLALHRKLIELIPIWWSRIESLPRTLVHNDFNPRNVAFRAEATGPRLVAYDWELATLHLPQRDVAELLCYVLTPEADAAEVLRWTTLHRQALEEATGRAIPEAEFEEGFQLALFDLAVNRFAFAVAAHTFRHYSFMERIVRTLVHLIKLRRPPS
jgi:NADP-dependent 3-hydroxy-3-methylglutaryl-CoA reductase